MILALNNFKNLSPLCLSRINTSWIVSTNVKENNLLIWSLIKVLKHTIEIKTLGLGIEIAIRFLLKTYTAWNCVVNGPSWGWCINFSSLHWVELL
jgi:hypothetical protein